MGDDHKPALVSEWPELVRKIRERTPARIFVQQGGSYTTRMELELRNAHACAVDAVWTEFDLQRDLPVDFVRHQELFEVSSQAESKSQFMLRPDLGRKLNCAAKSLLAQRCPKVPDFQIVIGDGLSVSAVGEQVPTLFALLKARAQTKNWSIGASFAVKYCRVGIMNDIGDLLAPRVLVLLIGERPGLSTATSLSAYMAHCPCSGQTDADRNLISNIHARGVPVEQAAERIINLTTRMMAVERSGATLKEETAR